MAGGTKQLRPEGRSPGLPWRTRLGAIASGWLAGCGNAIHATSVAVSREHRRAKTDRLDTAMLKRGFLGWLRGERGHCTVANVPTMEEEDAKHPHREREGLVHEQTRVVNRMKSALIQFGVRTFNP